jgi:hypothetical protein
VRVFQATNRHLARELKYISSFIEWRPKLRVTALGDNFEEGRLLGRLVVNGRFVAAAVKIFSKEPPYAWSIYRLNAATGRREVVKATPFGENQFVLHSPGVTDICVTPAGTVTWIVAPPAGEVALWRVYELPPESTTAKPLAASPTITRGSLACVAGHAYWLDNGVTGNAPIA